MIIHNSNGQQEPLGDVLLNRNLKEELIFSGKRILKDANLLCNKKDLLILESIKPKLRKDDSSQYQYELYDLESMKYRTNRKYDTLYLLNSDIYVARVWEKKLFYHFYSLIKNVWIFKKKITNTINMQFKEQIICIR